MQTEKDKQIAEQRYLDFAEEYVNNGCNARQAYLAIHPDASPNTSNGARYMKKPTVIKRIKEIQDELKEEYLISRKGIISKLISMADIDQDSETPSSKANSLRALDMLNKMMGNYTTADLNLEDMSVNINVIKKDSNKKGE